MTLLTHAIVGAAVGKIVGRSNIFIGIIFAFFSHFAMDAIRHGHYPLRSKFKDKNDPLNNDIIIGKDFLFDLIKIGFDFGFGLIFAQLFFNGLTLKIDWTILLYAFMGTLPDALQFAYFKIRKEPLISLQKFHMFMHAEQNFNAHPPMGIAVEMTAAFIAILLAKILT